MRNKFYPLNLEFSRFSFLVFSGKFFLLVVIAMSFAQPVLADGGIGYKGIYINKNGTKTWYKAHNVSWSYGGCGNFQFNSASDFSGQNLGTFTSSQDLQISGFAVVGWADGSDWVAGKLLYKIWVVGGTEPAWSEIYIGNYGNGNGATQVVCSNANDRVVGYDNGVTNINPGAPGSYNLKIQALGRMQWSGGFFNVNDGPEVTATFTITSSSTDYFRSKATGNWNVASNWESSANNSTWAESTVVPGASANTTTIRNGNIITLSATTYSRLVTIDAGGELQCGADTLKLANNATLTNNGTFTKGTGTVAFQGLGSVSGTIGFNHVSLAGGVNFGSSSTINGALVILNGGYVNINPPTYASSSNLLYYSGGTYGRSTEWSSTSGAGYPYNVTINNNTTLNLGNGGTGTARQCAGNFAIHEGSTLSMNISGSVMTAALTIGGNLTNNGTLTLSGSIGGDLNIKGNWLVTGTFNHNSRAVTFNGTSAQEITSGATTFGYLTIDNSEGVTINSTGLISVANNLTINSSKKLTINSGKSLTVTGTLTNTANSGLVIESGGSLVQTSGSVAATVKRSISAWSDAQHGWHYLSSPVSSQSISPNFVVTPEANYDFFKWDEATNMWLNQKVGGNNITSFVPGTGYLVAYAATSTKQFEGFLNNGPITHENLPISAGTNKGWHLLGNPFPCAITWATGWALTNINSTAKVWNETNASYSDIGSGGIIPALNGFMVQVTEGYGGDNSLTIPVSAMTHSSTAWYKNSDVPMIKLIANDLEGKTAQESILKFENGSTISFDPDFDSHFLKGYAPEFYSVAGKEQLSTNTLPELNGTVQVNFDFIKNDRTTFTVEAQSISGIEGPLILTDLKTGATQDLSISPVYAFTAVSGDDPSRFVLSFSHLGVNENQNSGIFSVFTYDNQIVVKSNKGQMNGQVEVFNMMGKTLLSETFSTNCSHTIPLSAPTGYYLVRVVTPEETQTAKVFVK